MYTPTANTASLQKLYIAYFGRPADYWGLDYWETDLANGGALANAAESFSIDTEYQAFAAGKTNGQLINAIYLNLFSHDADVPGLNYWVKEMSPQHIGPEQLTIARVAESIAYGAQAADTIILNDKIDAAIAFTGAIDTTPEINGYLGADAFASAAAWLFGVTDQASSDAAVAGANDAVAAAIAAGTPPVPSYAITSSAATIAEGASATFLLATTDVAAGTLLAYTITGTGDAAGLTSSGTVTVDSGGNANVTVAVPTNAVVGDSGTLVMALTNGNATSPTVAVTDATPTPQIFPLVIGVDNLSGTVANDTFDATVVANSLSTGDMLAGGGGNDAIFADFTNPSTSTLGTTLGIQTWNITDTGGHTLDMTNVTGVTTINETNSTGVTVFTNMNDVPTDVNLTSQAVGTTITMKSTALVLPADNINLTLNGVTAGTVTTGSTGVNQLESVTVISAGLAPNTLTALVTPGTTTINVLGAQDLNLGAVLSSTVTTLAAGTFTGDLTAILGTGGTAVTTFTGNDDITMGTGVDNLSLDGGDDIVRVATANLTLADTVAGGLGANSITFTGGGTVVGGDAAFTNVTDIQTLNLSAGNVLVLGALASGAGIVTVNDVAGGAESVTVGAGFVNALTVNLGDVADDVAAGAYTGILTVNAISTAGGANSIQGTNIITGGTGTSDTLNFALATGVFPLTEAAADLAAVSAIENFTFSGDLTNNVAIQLNAGNVATLETLTVTGSGLSGTFALDATAAVAGAIIVGTGGSGVNTFTGATLAATESFTGGGVGDTFNFLTGSLLPADTVAGMGGIDNITFTNAGGIVDSQFGGVSSVETVNLFAANTIILGATASTAGVLTVNTAAGGAETVTVGATFANALTVNLGDVADDVAAGAYTGVLTVNSVATAVGAGTASIQGTNIVTGGTGTSDTLNFTLGVGFPLLESAANLLNVTAIENFTFSGDLTQTAGITLNAANVTTTQSLTINGSGLSGALTVDASADILGETVIVTGGSAGDTFTGSLGTDNFSGNGGTDTFNFRASVADLASTDVVTGDALVDNITFTDAGTVIDTQFTNVSTVETINGLVAGLVLTLGAEAAGAGVVTVNNTGVGNITNVTAAFTGPLTINGDTANAVVNAGTNTNQMTVATTAITGWTGVVAGGTGTTDTLSYDVTGASIVQAANALITGFETINTIGGAGANSLSIALADATVGSGKYLTINGSGLTGGGFLTADLSLDVDGRLTVLGSAGNDIITGSASVFGDNLSGGEGYDTFTFANAQLNAADIVDGGLDTGPGYDTITFGAASTVVDGAFTQVLGIEVIQLGAGPNTITVGVAASNAGIVRINDGAGVDNIFVNSTFANALTVNLALGGADVLNAAGYTGALTVLTPIALTAADFLTAGTGTSDVLTFGAGAQTAASIANVTAFETFNNSDTSVNLILDQANTATGDTLTVDINTATVASTVDGTAETNGTLIILGGSAGDALTGGSLADTITGNDGADVITGNGGGDSIILGEGVASADTISYNAFVESTFSNLDSVTGFDTGLGATDDIVDFNFVASAQATATGYTTGVATGALAAAIAGELTLGAAILDAQAAAGLGINEVGAFEWQGDTYVFETSAANTIDLLVQLVAITGVTAVTEIGILDTYNVI